MFGKGLHFGSCVKGPNYKSRLEFCLTFGLEHAGIKHLFTFCDFYK